MRDGKDSDNAGGQQPNFDLTVMRSEGMPVVASHACGGLPAGPGAARRVLLQAPLGEQVTLDGAGTALEHPYVYDDVARELKALAATGTIEIIETQSRTHGDDVLICKLMFVRRR